MPFWMSLLIVILHKWSIHGSYWDTWGKVGMAVNTAVPDELKSGEKRALKMGFCPQKLLMPLAGS